MFPIIVSAEQVERFNEVLTAAQATGRTVAGLDLTQPPMTGILGITPIFDNGEDAEGDRYEAGEERVFLVCGKEVTEELAAARAAKTEQTDEKVEVEA